MENSWVLILLAVLVVEKAFSPRIDVTREKDILLYYTWKSKRKSIKL